MADESSVASGVDIVREGHERRAHSRALLNETLEFDHLRRGRVSAMCINVSTGGVFLEMADTHDLHLGDMVLLHIRQMVVRMRISRVDRVGIALKKTFE